VDRARRGLDRGAGLRRDARLVRAPLPPRAAGRAVAPGGACVARRVDRIRRRSPGGDARDPRDPRARGGRGGGRRAHRDRRLPGARRRPRGPTGPLPAGGARLAAGGAARGAPPPRTHVRHRAVRRLAPRAPGATPEQVAHLEALRAS
jgi:hypothetical protein